MQIFNVLSKIKEEEKRVQLILSIDSVSQPVHFVVADIKHMQ